MKSGGMKKGVLLVSKLTSSQTEIGASCSPGLDPARIDFFSSSGKVIHMLFYAR